jgi:hypothetical protein
MNCELERGTLQKVFDTSQTWQIHHSYFSFQGYVFIENMPCMFVCFYFTVKHRVVLVKVKEQEQRIFVVLSSISVSLFK